MPSHISKQIDLVNEYAYSLNQSIEELNANIERITLRTEEKQFRSIPWLEKEYEEYNKLIKKYAKSHESVMHYNFIRCSRYASKKIFYDVLNGNRYIRFTGEENK